MKSKYYNSTNATKGGVRKENEKSDEDQSYTQKQFDEAGIKRHEHSKKGDRS